MGDENGPGLFRQLELQIEQYNGNTAGKARLQIYEKQLIDAPPAKKLKNQVVVLEQPMVLSIMYTFNGKSSW